MPFSLTSVVVGTVLFALIASAVQPSMNASDSARLETAAEELSSLFRIAQAESVRLETPHGVIFDANTKKFQVVIANTTNEPFTTLQTAYHPVRKQPLTWTPDAWISLTPISGVFDYGIHGAAEQVMFDNWGTPLLTVAGVNRQLQTTNFTLATANETRTVTLFAVIGRVTVQ